MTNFLYNPDRKGKRQLIAEFVVRTQILDDIMQDIESSDMQTPEQHYLLVGQRGTGKTTLLHRIKYAIEDSKKVRDWIIPIIFSEEQYNISELANLWENICHTLEDYYDFENLHREIDKHVQKDNFEEIIYDVLEKHLNKRGNKLVLLIDNIGDLLRKLEDKEVRRLRELLQTKSHIRIIAASPFYLDNVLDYKQPLFEFFKVKRLDGLNKEETESLLLKLGKVYGEKEKMERILKETPERIETLRVLTGGVPRTIALMFRIFVDHEHESSVKDMERVLDAVTPLYKHRMDDLPKQQQKILDAVARNWDAITVKELKERIRLDSKTISAQLNQLEKNQVIEKRTSKTKNYLYLVKERFWNIWYLMRYGRKFDKERVVWLVKFLECWFSSQELEQRVVDFTKKAKSNQLPESTIELFGLVYASLQNIGFETRMNLKEILPLGVASSIKIDQAEVIKIIFEKIENNKFTEAFDLIRKIEFWNNDCRVAIIQVLHKIPGKVLQDYYKNLGSENWTLTDSSVMLLYLLIQAGMALAGPDFDIATRLIASLKEAFGIAKANEESYSLEFQVLFTIIKVGIIGDKVNLIYTFFTGENGEYFKSKLEIGYILVEYFRRNRDEAVLSRLPDEKKMIVLREIEWISEYRDIFKD